MNEPVFQKPKMIQRLTSHSRNNQVRFGERYDSQYMGSSQFEACLMSTALREMHGKIETGVFQIEGRAIYAAWNSENYNAEGVEHVLNLMWFDQVHLLEPSRFNGQTYLKQREDEKLPRKQRSLGYTDAWFDIRHGLFWTWEKINLKDIALNVFNSVKYMDQLQEERRERNIVAPRGQASLQVQMAKVRDQLSK